MKNEVYFGENLFFEEVDSNELYGDAAFLWGVGAGIAVGVGIAVLT